MDARLKLTLVHEFLLAVGACDGHLLRIDIHWSRGGSKWSLNAELKRHLRVVFAVVRNNTRLFAKLMRNCKVQHERHAYGSRVSLQSSCKDTGLSVCICVESVSSAPAAMATMIIRAQDDCLTWHHAGTQSEPVSFNQLTSGIFGSLHNETYLEREFSKCIRFAPI